MANAPDWAKMRQLHRAEGMPVRAIARRLGLGPNTVRRALEAGGPPKYVRPLKGAVVDVVELQIRGLLAEWPDMPATVIVHGSAAARPARFRVAGTSWSRS